MRFGIVVFPGSNCDEDAYHAAKDVFGQDADMWHKDTDLKGADVVILPGGFAHGDYLRTGAMARFSPVMKEVAAFADRGGPVLGICNGFQILLEAGLLPGAMLRNRSLKHQCEHVHCALSRPIRRSRARRAPARCCVFRLVMAKAITTRPETVARLEANRQIVLRYTDPQGRQDDASNPNGSVHAIASICNERRNVVGMMPHPERACEVLLGGVDGRVIFDSVISALARGPERPALLEVGRPV
jgi:phosphoribosylformylglycinamidine synthase